VEPVRKQDMKESPLPIDVVVRRRKIGIDVEAGSALIGSRVRIYWDGERKEFQGTISAFNQSTWKHTGRALDCPYLVCCTLFSFVRICNPPNHSSISRAS
jgi:hypothetical protein